MKDSVSRGTWIKTPQGFESLYNMLWAFSNFPFVTVCCIVLLVSALIKAILKRNFGFNNKALLMVFIWFLIPFLGMFLVSYRVPMYISRYLIFVLPAYYVLLSVCIDYLFTNVKSKSIMFGIIILLFAFTCELDPDKKQNSQKEVLAVKELKTNETIVLISPPDFKTNFAYYYNRNYFTVASGAKEYHELDSLLTHDNVYFLKEDYELNFLALSKYKNVIYYSAAGEYSNSDSGVLKELNKRYKLKSRKDFLYSHCINFFDLKQ